MGKYFAIVKKEYLQVVRDLPGLGLLFLMPALMLILITLTQEKVMTGIDSSSKVLLVNQDRSTLGNSIEEELNRESKIDLELLESLSEAEKLVYTGKYRVLVVIPEGSTEALEDLAWDRAWDRAWDEDFSTDYDSDINTDYGKDYGIVNDAARDADYDEDYGIVNDAARDADYDADYDAARDTANNMAEIDSADIHQLTGIRLLYDPAMMKLYKDIMGYSLERIIESAAIDLYLDAMQDALETDISMQFDQNLVSIEEGIAGGSEFLLEYNIVNNNVPAFILFAMFFIVIPLAGSILHEKQQGTRDRIMTLPVNWITMLLGKITVYLGVCLLQFGLMVAIGRYLIPQICELPPLSLDVHLGALMIITIASGLAAVGFGLLIGSLSSTFMQAAPIGSVLVVILAILGGIFVPNYMMPELISKISFISPMRWGSDAYFNIFARDAGLGMVLHHFFLLLSFFIATLGISYYSISKTA